MATSSSIAKAGWLYRESSFLKRWKNNWFVLSTDGILRYFENEKCNNPEGAVVLKLECVELKSGNECKIDSVPDGCSRDSYFSLVFLTQGTWNLCAENSDDMRAWMYTINDMRQGGPRARATAQHVSGVIQTNPMYPPQTVVYNSPGVTVVPQPAVISRPAVVIQDPFGPHYGSYQYGTLSSPFSTTVIPGAVLQPGVAPVRPYSTTTYTYY